MNKTNGLLFIVIACVSISFLMFATLIIVIAGIFSQSNTVQISNPTNDHRSASVSFTVTNRNGFTYTKSRILEGWQYYIKPNETSTIRFGKDTPECIRFKDYYVKIGKNVDLSRMDEYETCTTFPSTNFTGTWHLTESPDDIDKSGDYTITFHNNGTFSGHTGCNSFSGTYIYIDGHDNLLNIHDNIVRTEIACIDPDTGLQINEYPFFKRLQSTELITRHKTRLQLIAYDYDKLIFELE